MRKTQFISGFLCSEDVRYMSYDIYHFLAKNFHEHFDCTHSRKRNIVLSVVHRIVSKSSVESCGSDEVLPLIAGLLLESHRNRQ